MPSTLYPQNCSLSKQLLVYQSLVAQIKIDIRVISKIQLYQLIK